MIAGLGRVLVPTPPARSFFWLTMARPLVDSRSYWKESVQIDKSELSTHWLRAGWGHEFQTQAEAKAEAKYKPKLKLKLKPKPKPKDIRNESIKSYFRFPAASNPTQTEAEALHINRRDDNDKWKLESICKTLNIFSLTTTIPTRIPP